MTVDCQAAGPAAWPLQTYLELAAYPTAAACARGHVRSVALEWGLADLADTAEILASELVTNALQASRRLRTPQVPVVRLWVAGDGVSLVIYVGDGSHERPARQEAEPGDESGRGLMIVDALGASWGSYETHDGKIVWVQISVQPGELSA
jgi:anti-sigma regulatory factor (Ser/Thr protein kinase)